MLKSLIPFFALASIAAAQSCGTLAVTGSGAPGTQLDLALTGSTPVAFAFLCAGDTLGTTQIDLPTTSFTIGLMYPFMVFPLGMTDAAGDASMSFTVPANVPATLGFNAQALTLGFSFAPGTGISLSGCTSNVVSFTIG